MGIACLAVADSCVLLAQDLRLEIRPVVEGRELRLNQPQEAMGGARVTRLDFLLSKLALRRKDGTWLESKDWHAYMSAGAGRLAAEGSGVPAGAYTGLRFCVGVDEEVNKGDPHKHAADHALNPQVNGLHWGWLGGYIFMALEGRFPNEGRDDGFSYHVANAPQFMIVELPVLFEGGRPLTVTVSLDLVKVLKEIDPAKDGTSTHSRTGDPLAMRLKANVEKAFQVRRVNYDVYQQISSTPETIALPAGTHPFRLEVTQRFPKVSLPPDNPLTEEGVALGRRLFHDTRLSFNGTQSCASCHDQSRAFSDPRRFSSGAGGQSGTRNAMALFNLAWHTTFFWDGRAPTLRQQVLMPIQDKREMNETLPNVLAKLRSDAVTLKQFEQAFGTPEINEDRLAKALEQFLLTLVSQESRFDRAARKAAELSESEKRGLKLFVTEFDPERGLRGADCFHCHGGTLFTSQQFASNGLELATDDVGLMAVTHKEADRGKFKVPSLRNVARTAPYMHDGRFATLEQVVAHYSSGVRRTPTLDPNLAKHPESGLQLTPAEQADLVAFLKTLDDAPFTQTAAR